MDKNIKDCHGSLTELGVSLYHTLLTVGMTKINEKPRGGGVDLEIKRIKMKVSYFEKDRGIHETK